jgi:GDP-mannose 6-dehydrogenase
VKSENPTQVAVLGLGYVGFVTAACLASLGHRVLGIDRDQHKVDNVLNGRAPFYEPGLEELVENTSAGRQVCPARSAFEERGQQR